MNILRLLFLQVKICYHLSHLAYHGAKLNVRQNEKSGIWNFGAMKVKLEITYLKNLAQYSA